MELSIKAPSLVLVSSPEEIRTLYVQNEKGQNYYDRSFEIYPKEAGIRIPDEGKYILLVNGRPDGFKCLRRPLMAAKFTKSLPPIQRNRAKPYEIVTNHSLMGTPARIDTNSGVIEVSPRFHTFPVYAQKFIIEHEKGHFFYISEEYCDMYAARKMMLRGYNPSTVVNTLKKVLQRSPLATSRIQAMFNNLDS